MRYVRQDLLVDLNASQVRVGSQKLVVIVQQRGRVIHRRETDGRNAELPAQAVWECGMKSVRVVKCAMRIIVLCVWMQSAHPESSVDKMARATTNLSQKTAIRRSFIHTFHQLYVPAKAP